MRIEIVVLAALAALASAAPQWPYRDAVAPYYYGYPGKTPYMYRSNQEDDELDESIMGRQDLKVGPNDDGTRVTVVEDDEKVDGIRVVETGSAKPVAQSGNNPQAQSQVLQPQPAQQGNQPLNAQQQQQPNNGQPLTVQQPGAGGQQPPAFPPARPQNQRPRPAEEDEDEDEEDEESEEDDEDAEDDEEGDDDDEDEEDEEDDEGRKRNDDVKDKVEVSVEEPSSQQEVVPAVPVANSETSDEIVPEEPRPVKQQPSQAAVVNSKVNNNKEIVKGKKKAGSKVKTPGAIEALVPGYVTDQGEVLVPVDTVTGSQPITIVPDPFSPPSRIVGGPRPIPQSAIPSTPSRQVPYWYGNSPNSNPLTEDVSPIAKQSLYSPVPPPGSIFTFDDDDEDDEPVIPGNRLRQDDDDGDSDEEEEEDEEDEEKVDAAPAKVPLAAVAATGPSGEDDEADALNLVKPASTVKRPAKKPAGSAATDDDDEEEESEEDDVDSEEEDDSARKVAVASPTNNKGRMYVDEDYVSFPPSRSPTILAVLQGKVPIYSGSSPSREQQRYYSTPTGNPYRPDQRYVVRVNPVRRPPSPSLYYRPGSKVVPIASFDVSVEDTRPDSDEEEPSVVTPSASVGPFIYKVQGQLIAPKDSSGPKPSFSYYGGSYGPSRPQGYGPRPQGYGPRPQTYAPRPYPPPYASLYRPSYASSQGPSRPSVSPWDILQSAQVSFGPSRPRPPSGGPPVIVRRKPSGPNDRPPKPQVLAVYNPDGEKESVDEEYYTYEVPATQNKIVGPNKRPTVHRTPTPVIHQKLEEEEDTAEEPTAPVQIIPHGTVRRRAGKQVKHDKKPKKPLKNKKQQGTLHQDPLGILARVKPTTTKSKVL